MKHRHYDLIVKYYADVSQKVWFRPAENVDWLLLNLDIQYLDWSGYEYHIGDHPPKKRITMAGIQFDAPETVALNKGQTIFIVDMASDDLVTEITWENTSCDIEWLKNGMIHLSKSNCILHSRALIALNKELTNK